MYLQTAHVNIELWVYMAEMCGLQIKRTYCEGQKRRLKKNTKNNTKSIYLYMYEIYKVWDLHKNIVEDVLKTKESK